MLKSRFGVEIRTRSGLRYANMVYDRIGMYSAYMCSMTSIRVTS